MSLLALVLAMKVGGGGRGCVSLSVYCFSTDRTNYKQTTATEKKTIIIKTTRVVSLESPLFFGVVAVAVAVMMRH